jgi:NADH:ubiquinone oxidoreductase subunit B-like Fe-S oxidoreductase
MKIALLSLLILLLCGCMETPEAPASKEILAKEKIQNNKTEAQIAKEEYLKLQKHRASQ